MDHRLLVSEVQKTLATLVNADAMDTDNSRMAMEELQTFGDFLTCQDLEEAHSDNVILSKSGNTMMEANCSLLALQELYTLGGFLSCKDPSEAVTPSPATADAVMDELSVVGGFLSCRDPGDSVRVPSGEPKEVPMLIVPEIVVNDHFLSPNALQHVSEQEAVYDDAEAAMKECTEEDRHETMTASQDGSVHTERTDFIDAIAMTPEMRLQQVKSYPPDPPPVRFDPPALNAASHDDRWYDLHTEIEKQLIVTSDNYPYSTSQEAAAAMDDPTVRFEGEDYHSLEDETTVLLCSVGGDRTATTNTSLTLVSEDNISERAISPQLSYAHPYYDSTTFMAHPTDETDTVRAVSPRKTGVSYFGEDDAEEEHVTTTCSVVSEERTLDQEEMVVLVPIASQAE